MRDLLAHRVRATPDRTAVIDAGTGEPRTYAELDAAVEETAGRLAAAGVEPGDHLGLCLETSTRAVRLVHAAFRLGARLVPLNVRLTERELAAQGGRVDLDFLVCSGGTAAAARAMDAPARSIDPIEDVPALADETPAPVDAPTWSFDDVPLMLFTSGTTGEPKAVTLTAGNLLASAAASAFRLGVLPDDRWLCCLPIYHMGGLAPVLRSALYGSAVVVQAGFDPGATAAATREHAATGVSLVPTMLRRILDADVELADTLRFVLLGGAPASPALLADCADRGVPASPTYGLTETASQVTTATPAEALEHEGTVGRPLVGTDVTVVGDDGTPLPEGEAGEIVVSGPTVTPGYYDDPEATAAAYGPHGLHTGDVGYVEGGRLWVVGRLDDRIVTGGENVHPGEVVDALESHPAVEAAAVVGLEDPEWGERVAALVVAEGVDPGALREHCRERLAGYKCPKTIRLADALPRTASGTVDRAAVRERLAG